LQFDPESEARKLLHLMALSGVLPQETVDAMLSSNSIIDAEVVENEKTGTDTRQLESGSQQSGGNSGHDNSNNQ